MYDQLYEVISLLDKIMHTKGGEDAPFASIIGNPDWNKQYEMFAAMSLAFDNIQFNHNPYIVKRGATLNVNCDEKKRL